MKKFLFFMAALLLVGAVSAQQVRMSDGVKPQAKFSAEAQAIQTPSSRDVVFSEGFESTTGVPTASGVVPTFTPPLPTGWTKSNTTGHNWGTVSDLADVPGCGDDFPPKTGTRMMYNTWSASGNTWAFSPGFALEAGTAYKVSFWYNAMGWSPDNEPDNFEVRIGTTNTAAGMASAQLVFQQMNQFFNFDFIWRTTTFNFTPTTAGTYYLGFHDLRPAGTGFCIMIDDIEVKGSDTPTDVTITTNVTPAEAGSVTGGGTKPSGSNFTLTATAAAGYEFEKWTPGDATANPLELTNVTADATYTANFKTSPVPCEPVTALTAAYDAEAKEVAASWNAPATTPLKYEVEVTVGDDMIKVDALTNSYTVDVSELPEGDYMVKYCVTPVYDAGVCETIPDKVCGELGFSIIKDGVKNYTQKFSIVPNPATNNVTINSDYNFHKVEVLSFLGQVVTSQPNVGNKAVVDISSLAQGVYFVRIVSETGTSVHKLVKK